MSTTPFRLTLRLQQTTNPPINTNHYSLQRRSLSLEYWRRWSVETSVKMPWLGCFDYRIAIQLICDQQTQSGNSLEAFSRYITYERRAKFPDLAITRAVYERAISEAAKRRFNGEYGAEDALNSFWIGYSDALASLLIPCPDFILTFCPEVIEYWPRYPAGRIQASYTQRTRMWRSLGPVHPLYRTWNTAISKQRWSYLSGTLYWPRTSHWGTRYCLRPFCGSMLGPSAIPGCRAVDPSGSCTCRLWKASHWCWCIRPVHKDLDVVMLGSDF